MGLLDIIRRDPDGARMMAALPTGAQVGGTPREMGSDARSAYGAMVYAEQNLALAGTQRYAIFDEMRLSDPAVASLLAHVKTPILGAHWTIEPASADRADVAVADACRWAFGLDDAPGRPPLRGGWPTLLRQSLLFLDYGGMSGEIVWGELTPYTDADGTVHQLRPVVKVGPRYPSTVLEYVDPPAGSREYLGGVVQYQQPDVVIPGERVIHHVLSPENDPYRGTSLIRPCFGPWQLKKNLLISSAIAYDRYAAGVPVVRYPGGSDDETKEKAARIARGVRTNEQAWVTFEGLAEDGWDLEFKSGVGAIADPLPLLGFYNLEIMSAGLAKFAELGSTSTGSRAVGETLMDPHKQSLEAVAGQLASDLSDQLIGRFVEMNFGASVARPKLAVSKIVAHDLDVLGRYLASLAGAGVNVTDPAAVAHLRAVGGLPELPRGESPGTAPEGEDLPGGRGSAGPPAPPGQGRPVPGGGPPEGP